MLRYLIILLGTFPALLSAQTYIVPAPNQSKSVLIMNAKAHLGNGEVIDNSIIGFKDGKLTLVASVTRGDIDTKDYDITIDGSGKHVYPGFIAPNTTLGLKEVDAVRSTVDHSEIGIFNPNIRSIIAYNSDSKVIPTVRSNGVLMVQVVPEGGRLSGSSSIVQLDAWNWEDAVLAEDNGLHLRWPGRRSGGGWWNPNPKKNAKYPEQVSAIKLFFDDAQAYTKLKNPATKNLKLESMKKLFAGESKLFIHSSRAKDIMDAVLFAEQYNIKPVIVGARESYQITDFLKQHKISIILRDAQNLPAGQDEDIDQPYKTPKMLADAGVDFCLSCTKMSSSWNARNLPFQAGQSVSYGLGYEQAVAAVSGNTARILGIDKECGTLEKGKDATLFISEGDVFDMRTSKVSKAFIQGREIDLNNKQKALYEKYNAKFEREGLYNQK